MIQPLHVQKNRKDFATWRVLPRVTGHRSIRFARRLPSPHQISTSHKRKCRQKSRRCSTRYLRCFSRCHDSASCSHCSQPCFWKIFRATVRLVLLRRHWLDLQATILHRLLRLQRAYRQFFHFAQTRTLSNPASWPPSHTKASCSRGIRNVSESLLPLLSSTSRSTRPFHSLSLHNSVPLRTMSSDIHSLQSARFSVTFPSIGLQPSLCWSCP